MPKPPPHMHQHCQTAARPSGSFSLYETQACFVNSVNIQVAESQSYIDLVMLITWLGVGSFAVKKKKCVVKGRENIALFFLFLFLRKAELCCFHGETDESPFPPRLLYHHGGMVTHSYQVLTVFRKRVESFPSVIFLHVVKCWSCFFCTVKQCALRVWMSTQEDTPFDLSLGHVESRLHSSFSIVSGFILTLWFKEDLDHTSYQSYNTWSLWNLFCSLTGNNSRLLLLLLPLCIFIMYTVV